LSLFRSCAVVVGGDEREKNGRGRAENSRRLTNLADEKLQAPSSKLRRNTRLQTSKNGHAPFGSWWLDLFWCWVLGAGCSALRLQLRPTIFPAHDPNARRVQRIKHE